MLDFVDVNCLVGSPQRPGPRTPTSVEELEAVLDRFPISRSLVADVEACEYAIDQGNERVAALAAANPRFSPVWVMPLHTGVDFTDAGAFVAALQRHGVRAVRVQAPAAHGYTVDEWALGPAWRALEEARVPVLLANTELCLPPDASPTGLSAANVHDIARRYPRLPLVVLRLSGFSTRVVVPLMQACPNVHVELSYFNIHRGIETLASRVGADRLLFGSNLPWSTPGPAVMSVAYADIPDEDKQAIAGGNIRRLLDAVRYQ